MLIFIPAVSQAAAAKLLNVAEDQVLRRQNQVISTKQATDFAVSDRGTLISLAAFVNPTHVNNKQERKQNALLPVLHAYPTWYGKL